MSHTKIGSCDSLNFLSVLLFSNILWKKNILWVTINASLLLPTWAGMHTELILSVFVGLTSSTNSNGMTGHYCICKFHTFNGKNEAPVNWENDWSLLADINWNKELKSFQLQLFSLPSLMPLALSIFSACTLCFISYIPGLCVHCPQW